MWNPVGITSLKGLGPPAHKVPPFSSRVGQLSPPPRRGPGRSSFSRQSSFAGTHPLAAGTQMDKRYLIAHWEAVRQGLVETIDKFEDANLDFSPLPEGRTVREMILHIAREEQGESTGDPAGHLRLSTRLSRRGLPDASSNQSTLRSRPRRDTGFPRWSRRRRSRCPGRHPLGTVVPVDRDAWAHRGARNPPSG